ncbi:hypothetical protein ACFLZ0_01575 [Patescibacteria group bacterium]
MNKSKLENSIISTLIYYDVLGGYPLTAFEIYKYLDNCFCKFSDIFDILDNSSKIIQKNGFYFIKNNDSLIVKQRIERQKIADKKWRKTIRIVKWFQIVPYLRMVAVSGSLSLNNTKEQSDLDLLIMAKYGRVWIVRFFLSVLTQIIGQRRHNKAIKDKICLNQYITDEFLEFKLQNLSNAHSCANLVPILELDEFQEFINENQWLQEFLPVYYSIQNNKKHFKVIKQSNILRFIAKSLEFVFNNKLGDFIEKTIGNWQKNKIIRKVKPEYVSFSQEEMRRNTKAHLCLSNETLVFHYPISRNLQVQNSYNKTISCV